MLRLPSCLLPMLACSLWVHGDTFCGLVYAETPFLSITHACMQFVCAWGYILWAPVYAETPFLSVTHACIQFVGLWVHGDTSCGINVCFTKPYFVDSLLLQYNNIIVKIQFTLSFFCGMCMLA